MATPKPAVQTIEITNFGGRLTRLLNGEMNSGLAKFNTSFGYDPFTKPMNLTWAAQAYSVPQNGLGAISSIAADCIMAAKPRFESHVGYVYAIGGISGTVYKLQPNRSTNGLPNEPYYDSGSVIGTVNVGGPVGADGGLSMDFFGSVEKILVGTSTDVRSVNFDGSVPSIIGNTNNYLGTPFRPVKQFAGGLLFGNGNTVGKIDATQTVTSSVIGTGQGTLYSQFNPPLPVENIVRDIDVSIDGNYALVTATNAEADIVTVVSDDQQESVATDSAIYGWNGSDQGVTTQTTIPSYAVTALQTYLNTNSFFSNDAFGSSLNDGTEKILTLPNNKSPHPNATCVTGNFITWMVPESVGATRVASLYYFGSLDKENAPGLYRLLRYSTTLSNGFVYSVPLNLMVSGQYSTLNTDKTAISILGAGKHYFSTYSISSAAAKGEFRAFILNQQSTQDMTPVPQLGVYETQTQLFSKRIGVNQIRVYTEPAVANNGFQLDIIGTDGNIIPNGTFNYKFGDVSDPQSGSTAVERIDWNPNTKTQFGIGIRITNTGTTNMTIKKIEADVATEGK